MPSVKMLKFSSTKLKVCFGPSGLTPEVDHLVEILNHSALEAEEPECEPKEGTETV